MSVARVIHHALENASWIRRMFEAGRALKDRLGEDQVFDFSLGNAFLEPPEVFQRALRDLVLNPPAGIHRYMPNAGHLSTRKAVAASVSRTQEIEVDPDDVVMTIGAAGAIHVTLHAILDPGDEVIVLAPYFVEYLFYVQTHQGVPRVVQTNADFSLDLEAIDAAINDRTKAIIINTPNNPTGVVYTQQQMRELALVLATHERRWSRPIYMLADTPYANITYDGERNPLLFADHPHTIINHSHSKDLGLAGERVGYLVISPRAGWREMLRDACTFCNRVLGFINAPSLFQLALERSLDAEVDMSAYAENRRVLVDGLTAAGYELVVPGGAFYLFPRTPIEDDVAFTKLLQEQHVLVVPGRGFGRAGHIRIAFCVDPGSVRRSIPHFAAALERAKS